MNANNPFYDPKHWQKRAEATRAKAQVLSDEGARQKLLRVVKEYERLAERAERWLTLQRDKPSELRLLQRQPTRIQVKVPPGSPKADAG